METLQGDAIIPDGKLIPNAQCQDAFCRFILARTGIVIQEHQYDNLRHAVASACKRFGYTSAFEYLAKLEQGASPPRELEFLVSAITVRESYFFRDQHQIEFIRDIWLPGIIPKKLPGEKRLSIWSAGCSGGEEVFTIAILLMEALPDVQTWNISLLGTDINSVVLSDAASGVYKDWAFRTTPKHIRDKYFVKKDAAFLLNPNVRKMAQFKYLNLNDETFSRDLDTMHPFDMILCRNVFIYLDHRTVQGILKKFVSLLPPDGVLILGASDLVETNISGFELHRHQNMFYYQRRQEVFAPPKEVRPSARPPHEDRQPPKRALKKAPLPKQTVLTTPSPRPQKKAMAREEVVAMDRNGLWHEIPVFVDAYIADNGEDAFLVGMKAKALASLGNLSAAMDLCNHSIELDKTCKYCYYIKATILMEMGKLEDAQHALRRAIYLDHHFFEAHFHLGQLLVRFHNYKAGLKSLKNALELAEKADPERLLFIEQELTCGQLVEILKSEIGVYEARHGKGT